MLSFLILPLSQNAACSHAKQSVVRITNREASLFDPERLGHFVDALFAFYEQDYTTQLEINAIKATALHNARKQYQYIQRQGWKICVWPQDLLEDYLADALAQHARQCYEHKIRMYKPSHYVDRADEVETSFKEQAREKINSGRYGCLRFFVGESLEKQIAPFCTIVK